MVTEFLERSFDPLSGGIGHRAIAGEHARHSRLADTSVGRDINAAHRPLLPSLGRALAPDIRVVSVSPGWVLGEYAASMDPAMLQTQTDATPLGALATPADVSAVIHHLPMTTGSIIPVDGGRPLGT